MANCWPGATDAQRAVADLVGVRGESLVQGRVALMLEACYRRLLTPHTRNRVTIVNYHQVLAQPDPMRPDEITADLFRRLMGWVARNFHTLTLSDAMQQLADNALPERTLVITFDDGYRDNHSVALPILQQLGLRATFFIASDYLDGGLMWNDQVIEALRRADRRPDLQHLGLSAPSATDGSARQQFAYRVRDRIKHLPPAQRQQEVARICAELRLPTDVMLSSDQVIALHRAGMEIGGHTCSHPILSTLDDAQIETEISVNKRCLENLLQAPLRAFAYPNGKPDADYDRRAVDAVRAAGYEYAVTTCPGVAGVASAPLQLPRFTPWRRSRAGFLAQLYRNYTRPESAAGVACQG